MVRHSIRIATVHLISNGERMKTYEVTTTVTLTRKHMVEADGEETAKEQAESGLYACVNLNDYWNYAISVDVEHDLVEITSPNDEAKKYI
jgi:hypothetical protein